MGPQGFEPPSKKGGILYCVQLAPNLAAEAVLLAPVAKVFIWCSLVILKSGATGI